MCGQEKELLVCSQSWIWWTRVQMPLMWVSVILFCNWGCQNKDNEFSMSTEQCSILWSFSWDIISQAMQKVLYSNQWHAILGWSDGCPVVPKSLVRCGLQYKVWKLQNGNKRRWRPNHSSCAFCSGAGRACIPVTASMGRSGESITARY